MRFFSIIVLLIILLKKSLGVDRVLNKKSLFILPGTNWCGSGHRATSCDDLGDYAESDKCCRKHDNCPLYLISESRNYGFKWNGLYTMSHCECDVIVRNTFI